MRLENKKIYGQHYLNIYCIYYVVYSSFISYKLQVYMSSNDVYVYWYYTP